MVARAPGEGDMVQRLVWALVAGTFITGAWQLGAHWPSKRVQPPVAAKQVVAVPALAPSDEVYKDEYDLGPRPRYDSAEILALEAELAAAPRALPLANWSERRAAAVQTAQPLWPPWRQLGCGPCSIGPDDETYLRVFGQGWRPEPSIPSRPEAPSLTEVQRIVSTPGSLREKNAAIASLAVHLGSSCTERETTTPLAISFHVAISHSNAIALWGPAGVVTWVPPTATGQPDQEEALRLLLAQVPEAMPWHAYLFVSPGTTAEGFWTLFSEMHRDVQGRLPPEDRLSDPSDDSWHHRPGVELTTIAQLPSGEFWTDGRQPEPDFETPRVL